MTETWSKSQHYLMVEPDRKPDLFDGNVSIPSSCKDYFPTVNVLMLFCVLQIENKMGFINI